MFPRTFLSMVFLSGMQNFISVFKEAVLTIIPLKLCINCSGSGSYSMGGGGVDLETLFVFGKPET